MLLLVQDTLRGHKMRASGACAGAIIGLVAITPAAGEHEAVVTLDQVMAWCDDPQRRIRHKHCTFALLYNLRL